EAGNTVPPDQLPGRRVLKGDQGSLMVLRFGRPPLAEQRWSIVEARPVTDSSGRLLLVVNIFRDITDRKRRTDAMAFLAEAGTVLSASLEGDSILEQLAQLSVRGLADFCAVDLAEPRGHRRVVEAYAASELDQGLLPRSPMPPLQAAVERVLLSARAELVEG